MQQTISLEGSMRFDIDDISDLESGGTFENVIIHEMGHVIGIGYGRSVAWWGWWLSGLA